MRKKDREALEKLRKGRDDLQELTIKLNLGYPDMLHNISYCVGYFESRMEGIAYNETRD